MISLGWTLNVFSSSLTNFQRYADVSFNFYRGFSRKIPEFSTSGSDHTVDFNKQLSFHRFPNLAYLIIVSVRHFPFLWRLSLTAFCGCQDRPHRLLEKIGPTKFNMLNFVVCDKMRRNVQQMHVYTIRQGRVRFYRKSHAILSWPTFLADNLKMLFTRYDEISADKWNRERFCRVV